MHVVLLLFPMALNAAALRTPLMAQISGGGVNVGPYEYLRTASLDECVAAAPFFCDQLQVHHLHPPCTPCTMHCNMYRAPCAVHHAPCTMRCITGSQR